MSTTSLMIEFNPLTNLSLRSMIRSLDIHRSRISLQKIKNKNINNKLSIDDIFYEAFILIQLSSIIMKQIQSFLR